MQRAAFMLLGLIILSGCQTEMQDRLVVITATASTTNTPQPTFTPTFTPTSTPIPSSTPTPTPTLTPTPTPTPTPTALAAAVSGDPRAARLTTPSAQGFAQCGIVDILDFPLNPPDGDNVARGGQDFGIYRSRYSLYHAGEDWWRSSGGSSFGAPVYSIGHGRVTFAQPLGWGRDKGVVIIRHIFPDGRDILSFYGHLDPPSVILNAGDCVARGDKLGEIGRPSTAPHLHFEIRSHLPYEPGSGYWPVDPTLEGWKPPSQTIWDNRISGSPGVLWTRAFDEVGVNGIGIVNGDTFIGIEEDRLIGFNIANGASRNFQLDLEKIDDALIDADHERFYTVNQFGEISAYRVLSPESDFSAIPSVPLWTIDLDVVGFPTLMPLPGGGVVMSLWQRMFAVSQDGILLWETNSIRRPFDWAVTDDSLVFSTIGGNRTLWTSDESEVIDWETPHGGHLFAEGDQLLLHDENGAYRLDPGTLSAELLVELPRSNMASGDVVALPAGTVLISHVDRYDRRVIMLEADGTMRWERSYDDAIDGDLSFLLVGEDVYLLSQSVSNSASEISIYSIDLETAEITLIFTGGSRSSNPDLTHAFTTSEGLILLNIGGASLALIDPQLAAEAASPDSISP